MGRDATLSKLQSTVAQLTTTVEQLTVEVRRLRAAEADGGDPVSVEAVLRGLWLHRSRSRLKGLPDPILRQLVARLLDVHARPCDAYRWLREQNVGRQFDRPSAFYRFVRAVRAAAATVAGYSPAELPQQGDTGK